MSLGERGKLTRAKDMTGVNARAHTVRALKDMNRTAFLKRWHYMPEVH